MSPFDSVTDNLRFMVHEAAGQVEQTLQFFAEPSRTLIEKIRARDDYIDTLKSLILDKTYSSLISGGGGLDKNHVNLMRSVNIMATNLERIADFSVNMLRQAEHLTDISFLNNFDLEPFFEEVLTGLDCVPEALDKKQVKLAFRICQCEFNLDVLYESHFKIILAGLQTGKRTGNLVTVLMILHYLERMGDSLLNIGEALLFAFVGEQLKIQQYKALTESLSASGLETPISQVEFESIWGTRSGCRIGLVGEKNRKESARPVLFKHGNFKKLQREKDNIARWEKLSPGLPPQVYECAPGDDGNGSILLEYLPGCTFQEIVTSSDENMMKDALFIIEETMGHLWKATQKMEPVKADFTRQLKERLTAIYRLHPDFNTEADRIGSLDLPSYGQLMRVAAEIERDLAAPFSVFIHGDFNANNLIYDSSNERLHFIDLHRSAQSDYVQDVSVFLVSIYRMPIFDRLIRARLNFTIMDFFEFARDFAIANEDNLFEARLAFGLARSFGTSTRFELNRKFANKMFKLSVYLLEKLIAHRNQPWDTFELPGEVLVY